MTSEAATQSTNRKPRTAHAVESRQILGLDLIRFAAALLVVAFHLGYWNRLGHSGFEGEYQYAYLAPFARIGWVGVDIFFVLSGFVIAYSAEKATPLNFAKSRILRLYPAVWFCSTITLAALFIARGLHPFLVRFWLYTIVLYPFTTLIDQSYWTLGIELSFYVVIFCLLAAGWFRYLGAVMTAIAAINTACLAYTYAAERAMVPVGRVGRRLLPLVSSRDGQLLLLQHGSLFALGVLLWLCLFHGVTSLRIVAVGFCLFGSLLAIRNDWLNVVNLSGTSFSPAVSIAVWALAIAAIIFSVKQNAAIAHWIGPRGAKATRTLGLITYPLYLIHQQLGDELIAGLHGHIPDIVSVVLAALAAFGVAYISVTFAEKRLQARLKRVLNFSRKTPAAPASTLP